LPPKSRAVDDLLGFVAPAETKHVADDATAAKTTAREKIMMVQLKLLLE